MYIGKSMQSEIYKGLEERDHQWMRCNVDSRTVSAIIAMQEQMVETRSWKSNRETPVKNDMCRLCGQNTEGVMHLVSGCKCLAALEYLNRHDNVLKVLMTAWCKEHDLMEENLLWYKVKWNKGSTIENEMVTMT